MIIMMHLTKFTNRVDELAFLERMFARSGAQMLVLWGRRRVGKTELLREFSRDKRMLYSVGTQSTERVTLANWCRQAAEFFQDPLLQAQPLETWEAALVYLTERASRSGGFGLILDEFPYLVEATPSLPSQLQAAWDEHLRHTDVKLILCGSSVAMMESLFFSSRAPLYGRRTGQWKLEPFRVPDLGLLLKGKSLVELLEHYCVVGGMPMYSTLLDPGAPLLENIHRFILARGEVLYEEVPFLLREELREPRVYQSILAALAMGSHKFSELSSKTGLDRAHLTAYLGTLAELGLVEREVPVTEPRPEKSRRGRYRILDPFVRFWYRFVFSNLSRLELGQTETVLAEIAGSLHEYVSLHVEEPIADLLRRGPLADLAPFPIDRIGRHWSSSEELDLVALDRAGGRALVGEVKWSRQPVPISVVSELNRRIESCLALKGVAVTRAVISRSGFRGAKPEGVLWVDLSA